MLICVRIYVCLVEFYITILEKTGEKHDSLILLKLLLCSFSKSLFCKLTAVFLLSQLLKEYICDCKFYVGQTFESVLHCQF